MPQLVFIHDHYFYIKEYLFYSGGGLPSYVWMRYLRAFESMTVIGREGSELPNKIVLSSREGVDFKLLKSYKGPFDYIFNKAVIKSEIRDIIKIHKAAIVRLPSVVGILALEICHEEGIPVIIEVVGSAYDSLKYSGIKGKFFGSYMERKMKRALLNAKYSVYVTKKYLQNTYPTNVKSIDVSNVMIQDIDESALKFRINKINNEAVVFKIGLIGALSVPYKGHSVLLKAITLLANKTDVELMIYFVGGGSSRKLSKLIEDLALTRKVSILGPLKAGEEIKNFIDSIDLYVHPSFTEGLPRVIIEAFSRGCPVLGSDAGGIPELLDEKYVHHSGDHVELSTQLLNLINDKSELLKMAIHNFKASKEFESSELDRRREDFLLKFKSENKI